ncbi:MAG TPA: ABC transporter permease subunit [Afifellaceae bacterium]|nr:ABC transporter permease subunit [Afifellaceae bacterium]
MKRVAILDHAILIAGCLFMVLPVLTIFLTSTHDNLSIARNGLQFSWGGHFLDVYGGVLTGTTGFFRSITAAGMLANSLILALGMAIGKCTLALLSAYALVYFRFRYSSLAFWLIFTSLLLPIETRIVPTFLVVSDLGMLNSYTGLILPLLPAAIGTLFFRQFFKSVPEELAEAARLDGAGPFRFLVDILIPISRPVIVALFVITFVEGWNQYLWPLMVSTTDEGYFTIVRGIGRIGGASNSGMALSILAMLPPVALVIVLQRWLVRGLTDGFH